MEETEKKWNPHLIRITSHFIKPSLISRASVAQLVERNLAKVDVESSSLFTRSIFLYFPKSFHCIDKYPQGFSSTNHHCSVVWLRFLWADHIEETECGFEGVLRFQINPVLQIRGWLEGVASPGLGGDDDMKLLVCDHVDGGNLQAEVGIILSDVNRDLTGIAVSKSIPYSPGEIIRSSEVGAGCVDQLVS